ncbi:3-oxoacyl-ACP synthase [Caballeronia concitans]|uniref:3-oxoacyl-(Acyl carrier protein) synthase n=1 Tax=Caballeronia concitans TaxID=1777133 RepID=A0A658QVA8_9BURK|nr:3-oxoacyl-ACP synthase [Caballeronia concitans]KIG09606.1 Beta-ketoacyl synthase [Burkholderia sp. MR1]SAL24612.1 3-oxoacyl-(acyl carrier protein) synthase [Caballeronia concitans]
MNDRAVGILSTGLVTSAGWSAPATCAAIRAKISNATESPFIDCRGEWIVAHQVPFGSPWRGRTKLAYMAAMAIGECLEGVPKTEWRNTPLLMCVAEMDRPGRTRGLDDTLPARIADALEAEFSSASRVIPWGRVSVAVAMEEARTLLHEGCCEHVVIAAADSLLNWRTLRAFEDREQLRTSSNSNGFIPGEAGGAVLVGRCHSTQGLSCVALGFGKEDAHIHSEMPLRADGMAAAVKIALSDANLDIVDCDFRICDLSGEQYYFDEASLTVARLLRAHKETFPLWHPAECMGETGAVAGIGVIATAHSAFQKRYAPGARILAHLSNDAGERAAMIFHAAVAQ